MMRILQRQRRHGSPLKAGLIGFAAGAAVCYYLFGTSAGEEKREDLMKKARGLKSFLECLADEAD